MENDWIRLKKRLVKASSITAINFDPDKFELRAYEINGYTNVIPATEKEVAKLVGALNTNIILELGDK